MHRRFFTFAAVTLIFAGWSTAAFAANPEEGANLLQVREAVWRSWFANDSNALKKLVPPETIVISSGESKWKHQAEILHVKEPA
jgi:hypothetical protein